LVDGAEALLGSELLLENVARILDLSTAGASQIAPIQRLEHEHERVPLASLEFLLEDVTGDRPHLGRGNRHTFRVTERAGLPLRCKGWQNANARGGRTASSGWSPGRLSSSRSRSRRTRTGPFAASATSGGRYTARFRVT